MGKKIESQANYLLEEYGFNRAPVNVEKLALKMDLAVLPTDLGPGVSGALVIKSGIATIGINPNESRVRRRFTVAHELGHYVLHSSSNALFVDKSRGLSQMVVLFRDGDSASGEQKQEMEANAFAAALLMPEKLLRQEMTNAFDIYEIHSDEELIELMAKKFDVSEIAMTYRLTNLHLVGK